MGEPSPPWVNSLPIARSSNLECTAAFFFIIKKSQNLLGCLLSKKTANSLNSPSPNEPHQFCLLQGLLLVTTTVKSPHILIEGPTSGISWVSDPQKSDWKLRSLTQKCASILKNYSDWNLYSRSKPKTDDICNSLRSAN